jgi:uncharacterized protein YqgC (DUF456 family)
MQTASVAIPAISLFLLALTLLGGILMVPLGLPGLWVMLAAAIMYWLVIPAGGVGLVTVLAAGAIVIVAEVLEYAISGRYTRKYGGSSRASWGAILGGLAGAVVGVPVPVVGSLFGAFVGAFVGAFIGEMTMRREDRGEPVRVATGALVGRAVAAAVKSGLGLVVAILVMASAIAA